MNEPIQEPQQNKFVAWFMKAKNWILGLGTFGIILWWIIKIIICTFFGICLL